MRESIAGGGANVRIETVRARERAIGSFYAIKDAIDTPSNEVQVHVGCNRITFPKNAQLAIGCALVVLTAFARNDVLSASDRSNNACRSDTAYKRYMPFAISFHPLQIVCIQRYTVRKGRKRSFTIGVQATSKVPTAIRNFPHTQHTNYYRLSLLLYTYTPSTSARPKSANLSTDVCIDRLHPH